MNYAKWSTNAGAVKPPTAKLLKRYMTTNPPAACEGAVKRTREVIDIDLVEFKTAVDYGYIIQTKQQE